MDIDPTPQQLATADGNAKMIADLVDTMLRNAPAPSGDRTKDLLILSSGVVYDAVNSVECANHYEQLLTCAAICGELVHRLKLREATQ